MEYKITDNWVGSGSTAMPKLYESERGNSTCFLHLTPRVFNNDYQVV